MNYIYYVVIARTNVFAFNKSGTQFMSLEMATSRKLTTIEEVRGLLPVALKAHRQALIEHSKNEEGGRFTKALEDLPLKEDNSIIVSFTFLRKE